MPLDSDVALLGTGVAPLVAANQLASQGYSVLLLNPDSDFFLEDSELSLDPLWPREKGLFSPARLQLNNPQKAIEGLRPSFPGAVEYWSGAESLPGAGAGFHDPAAPHVRQRARLFVLGPEASPDQWEFLEDLYVAGADWGLKPQLLEGLQSVARFPGFSGVRGELCRGLLFPGFCDYDVTSYRNGLLEFVRERLGPERVICGAGQVELMPGGLRFTTEGKHQTARIRHGMLTFWTPRLTQWVLARAKEREVTLPHPKGVRLWEQWSLASREPVDPKVIGNYRNMTVWAEADGIPSPKGINRMSVLLAGPLMDLKTIASLGHGLNWADSDSFKELTGLCCDFLNWERFSVRSMRPRAMLEWNRDSHTPFQLTGDPQILVVTGCDGPLVDVVGHTRAACERVQGGGTA